MIDSKSFLKQIRLYDSRINTKIEEIQHLKEMLLKVTPSLKEDVVSGGGISQDKLGDAVAKIVDLEDEINREIDCYIDAMNKTSSIIDNIDDPDQLKILHMRYVQYKTWEQIAYEMNMSYRNVCYIHGKALQAANEIMKAGAK